MDYIAITSHVMNHIITSQSASHVMDHISVTSHAMNDISIIYSFIQSVSHIIFVFANNIIKIYICEYVGGFGVWCVVCVYGCLVELVDGLTVE